MEAEVSFGAWVARQRKALDLTRKQLAGRIGCSVPGLRKIENDERRPSRQMAELLADGLQVPPDQRPTFLQVARGHLRVERLSASEGATATGSGPGQGLPRPAPHLPTPPTPLIGRELELAALARLLGDAQCRLLTLVGPGGIGKTRLALEIASSQQELFPDGVYFVPLASLSSPQFIVPTIGGVLDLKFSSPVDPQMQLLSYLREKCLLLVLDNFEHLLEGGEILAELLQQTPGVKLLVTSRERLNLQGEWLFDIQGLPVPPPGQVDWAEEYSAVGLFVQRAWQAQTGFELGSEERFWIGRICQLVEGMPLAIELAATWVRILSCREIAQEIERNLDFLAASVRDMPERHRSMRAVFDQSWRMLSQEERQVLNQLSVFRGGFRREAAKQTAGATLGILSDLVAKSFLRRTAAGRYDLHELIRQYALEKLQDSGQFEETCHKHLTYLVALAQEAKEQLRGPQQVEWHNQLEQEHDNMQAALVWSFAPGAAPERVERGLQLVVANYRFWQGRGYVREGIAWLERGLQASDSISPAIRANALSIAGWLVSHGDDNQRAAALLQESVTLNRQLNNQRGLAFGLDFLGDVAWRDGDFAAAKAYYAESLALYRKCGDLGSIGMSLYSAGRLHVDYGYYQEAGSLLNEGLSVLEDIPDWRGIALCLNGLGRLALFQGDPTSAAMRFCEALQLNHKLGNKVDIAECLQELAMVAVAMGLETRAIRLWSAANALRERIGVSLPATDPLYRQAPPTWFSDVVSSSAWTEGQAMSLEQAIAYALAPEED